MKINMKFPDPIILKFEDEEYLSWTVSDDLPGLLKFILSANCKQEERKGAYA